MPAPNPFDQQKPIPGVKHVVAVSSGKGGVGKSTVAVNLAAALAQKWNVGLLDADIHGPSVPRMTGTLDQKPEINAQQKLLPIKRWGLQIMSIGHLVDEQSAIIWRGPMLFKALDQFFFDVAWDNLDVLVIDLPPGTGDVQLTMAQKVPVSGAICVSTPQNLALADVKKAIDMWKRVSVPLIGVVENMAYLELPDGQEAVELFPRGELTQFLDHMNIPLLTRLPFYRDLAKVGEAGVPMVQAKDSGNETKAFKDLAQQVSAFLGL